MHTLSFLKVNMSDCNKIVPDIENLLIKKGLRSAASVKKTFTMYKALANLVAGL